MVSFPNPEGLGPPAEALTRRQIAKLMSGAVSGLIGVVSTWSDLDDVLGAIKHFEQHHAAYFEVWRRVAVIASELPKPPKGTTACEP